MKRLLRCCTVILALAVYLGFPRSALAQKLTVGSSAVSALNAPFWIVKEAGFLNKEGLDANFAIRTLLEKHNLKPITDVPIVQIGGMPEIAAALSNGAIAAAPISYPVAYVAQQNGVKLLARRSIAEKIQKTNPRNPRVSSGKQFEERETLAIIFPQNSR